MIASLVRCSGLPGQAGPLHCDRRVGRHHPWRRADDQRRRCRLARDPDNIRRLVEALQPHRPYLRGAPPGLPFRWDERTVQAGLNFTLTTSLGEFDRLGEVTGGGNYGQLLPFTQEVTSFGITSHVVTLERLTQLKRAAGRPKDLEAIAELQALLEERRKSGPGC